MLAIWEDGVSKWTGSGLLSVQEDPWVCSLSILSNISPTLQTLQSQGGITEDPELIYPINGWHMTSWESNNNLWILDSETVANHNHFERYCKIPRIICQDECCMWTALAELSSWAQAENFTLDSFGRAESGDDILDTTSWVVWRISSSHASL